jgi:hypothetical protein
MKLKGVSVFALLSVLNASCAGSSTRQVNNVPRPPTLLPQVAQVAQTTTPNLGQSCKSGDPHSFCLGIKIVAYADPRTGATTLDSLSAVSDLKRVNTVWSQCEIAFQIDHYSSVNPTTANLAFSTSESDDLNKIRSNFSSDQSLLLVSTGRWDRAGSLGRTPANAWTTMPGAGPYGAIFEEPVATTPNIIAHELGHYLSLTHVSDRTDLMNPIIYPTSSLLTSSQCELARNAITDYWPKMLR